METTKNAERHTPEESPEILYRRLEPQLLAMLWCRQTGMPFPERPLLPPEYGWVLEPYGYWGEGPQSKLPWSSSLWRESRISHMLEPESL
jgi:hypothetical protein